MHWLWTTGLMISSASRNTTTHQPSQSKRADLHNRQAGLRVQLEASNRDGHEIAELAIRAFELSQSLGQRWVKADYDAKRTILSVMLETVRLNCGNLQFSLRKPFDLLRNENLVPLSGAMGI